MLQAKALAILKSGRNVFLTGSAGTGKTYLINQYIDYLKSHDIDVAITASTGIAATHIGGQTIHSFCGIGIRDALTGKELKSIKEKKYISSNLTQISVLVIDEISMLHLKQLELVSKVLQYVREDTSPFGGVQIVLCGDFFQMPPISKTGESDYEKFAFMAPCWLSASFTVCYLTIQYRQSRNELMDVLDEIRGNRVSQSTHELLKRTMKPKRKLRSSTYLYTHNVDVDAMNLKKLGEIHEDEKKFLAITKGNQKIVQSLRKSVLAPETLKLKKGAVVMFVRNNPDEGYLNGTMGTVVGFDLVDETSLPKVKLKGGRTILASTEEWRVEDVNGKKLASYEQFPLRLGWAITVHKSQGMTLEEAEMDLSKTFEAGQGYVALSRLKDIGGLTLHGYNDTALRVNDLALKADKRFQVLSANVDLNLPEEKLETEFEVFILNSGGRLKAKKGRRKKSKKSKKRATHEVTTDLVLQGMSIDDIAREREYTRGTIIGHLLKIRESGSEIDLDYLRPKNELIDTVQKAVEKLKEKDKDALLTDKGMIRLGPIHSYLNRQLDYDMIKLCLIFVE